MIWAALLTGLAVAIFGAVAGTALVSLSRMELTRAVAGQLKGDTGSLAWLAEMEGYLGVTATLTALGVIVVGASLPPFLAGFTTAVAGLLLVARGPTSCAISSCRSSGRWPGWWG